MKYRAEIDGLRALAVVPVILFHAGFELFSGGFVGVDVFFVISGYLITTILIEDIENQRFSIVNFYERRARRILPALFFVMLVCIPFAWLWMIPSQMKDFSQSLVAVSLFASNILFWRESGYFDAASEEKPLLHTWSLAVEEQYYVLFPIFLISAWRFGKNRVFWMIVVMAAISLLLSEWGWRNKATANFYLAPTRAWELFAGSIAAFIVQKQGVQKNNFLATLGLAAIIFSIFFYDETTPFPSVYALVPVMGVVLLVLYAEIDTLAAKVLSTKGFVGVGLISYSAYLWHQPLLAFARIEILDTQNSSLMLLLSISSILIGYISYRFIETPFRKKTRIAKKKLFFLALSGLIAFGLVGLLGQMSNGFEFRYRKVLDGDIGHIEFHKYLDENYVNCELPENYSLERERCRQSNIGIPDWILLGDSHAKHYFIGFAESFKDVNIAFYIDWDVPLSSNPRFAEIFEILQKNNNKIIFLTMHFAQRVSNKDEFYAAFSSTIYELQKMGHRVVLLGDVPRYTSDTDAENCAYSGKQHYCSISIQEYKVQRALYEETLRELSTKFNVDYIEADSALCSSTQCTMRKSNDILYRDISHLNIKGSKLVGDSIKGTLMKYINE